MALSRSIHVAANGIISVFLMAEWYPTVCMCHIFFIHSSVDGLLGCFHILAIVNSAAVNTDACILSDHDFLQIHAQEWDCRVMW